jgi:NADPH-dependent glutamate synthase beta subunit-like oxidoreductase
MIRSQIPRFRLPESVIDEEVGYVLDMGVEVRLGHRVDSMKSLLAEDYQAILWAPAGARA